VSIDTDYAVLRSVLTCKHYDGVTHLNPSPEPFGWAVEFGVYSGYSLGIIAAYMPVIGFDSFEGLPEDWRDGFPEGAFAVPKQRVMEFLGGGETVVSEEMILPHHPNAMIVPGWFEDTAPSFPFPPLGLVHIDCDLYSSTVTALDAVLPHIEPGTVIVFDEYHGYDGWEQHEAKAWGEFIERHRVIYTTVAEGEQEMAFAISHIGDR